MARWALTEGGIQRVWLTTNTDNIASTRVAEKAGFRREGTFRRSGREDDGPDDLVVYSLLDDELWKPRVERHRLSGCTLPRSPSVTENQAVAAIRIDAPMGCQAFLGRGFLGQFVVWALGLCAV